MQQACELRVSPVAGPRRLTMQLRRYREEREGRNGAVQKIGNENETFISIPVISVFIVIHHY